MEEKAEPLTEIYKGTGEVLKLLKKQTYDQNINPTLFK